MTPKQYLTNQKFCPIPWTGFMYNFDGNVKNCIRSSGVIGNIKENSIEQILHGEQNSTTKELMLANSPGPRCMPCYDLESEKNKFDIISDRIFYLRELKQVPQSLYSNTENFDLHTVDIRWSNLCNFACVYCGPEFSSKWADELKIPISTPVDQQKQNLKNYVFDRAAQLQHVYLAGGEPLLMKENLEFLKLLQIKNPEVNLRINTNLSKVDTGIFNLICKFKNVHWIVSVETMEEEYEYIRYGGKWNDFLINLRTVQKLNHKISFNMLYFLLNYKSIFDCIDFLKNMGFHNNSFIVGSLSQPDYLNVRHLPEVTLNYIKKVLTNKINEKPGFLLENGYRNILQYVNQPVEQNLSESFTQLKLLDQQRGLDSTKIFKDLYKHK